MAARHPKHRVISSRIAVIARESGPGDARLSELRGDLAAIGHVSDLYHWADLAAELPQLDQNEVAAVGAIAARLDSRISVRQGGGADAA